jgi:hypothetical protein
MKLYKILLLLIVIITSLLLGSQTIREGARRRRPQFVRREYSGVMLINTQLIALKELKKQIKSIPSYETTMAKRDGMLTNVNLVIDGMQKWLTNRVRYLNAYNNIAQFPPSENESIDGLRRLWIDNGIGYKILLDGIVNRLQLGEESQSALANNIKKITDNVNIELNISNVNTNPVDDTSDAAFMKDILSKMDSNQEFPNIFDMFDTPDDCEMTYEERYS